jgi:uncharacterized protein
MIILWYYIAMTYLILHGVQGTAGDHWENWLNDELTKAGHTVLMPQLPDSDHPDRKIWLKTVKEILAKVDVNQLVIVGHSLGVVTALDFIEQSQQKVRGLVSVSGFYRDYGAELNSYFLAEKTVDIKKVRKNLGKAVTFYGDNDPYVPQFELKLLAEGLGVKPIAVAKGGHLNTDAGFTSFPQLLQEVKKCGN